MYIFHDIDCQFIGMTFCIPLEKHDRSRLLVIGSHLLEGLVNLLLIGVEGPLARILGRGTGPVTGIRLEVSNVRIES